MAHSRHGPPLDKMRDKNLVRKIQEAQTLDGIPYGRCWCWDPDSDETIPVFVDVSFYPKRRWYMHIEGEKKPTELFAGGEYELSPRYGD